MKRALPFLALALLPIQAHAYLPPAFFVYSKLVDQKTKNSVHSAAITVARPQAGGTEEILGTITISGWQPGEGSWPTLSLIFQNDSEALIRSVTAFGIEVAREPDLLQVPRDKLAAMKDPPVPFYRPDPAMSLKRTRQTFAWVHGNHASGKSVWVEKDSFLPLKIAAPCPPAAAALAWAKPGEDKCEMEFRSLSALRRGNFQSARLTLWKDGAPLLFFTFDKVASGKTKLPATESTLTPELKGLAEQLLH